MSCNPKSLWPSFKITCRRLVMEAVGTTSFASNTATSLFTKPMSLGGSGSPFANEKIADTARIMGRSLFNWQVVGNPYSAMFTNRSAPMPPGFQLVNRM